MKALMTLLLAMVLSPLTASALNCDVPAQALSNFLFIKSVAIEGNEASFVHVDSAYDRSLPTKLNLQASKEDSHTTEAFLDSNEQIHYFYIVEKDNQGKWQIRSQFTQEDSSYADMFGSTSIVPLDCK